jgi:hypothetical protein
MDYTYRERHGEAIYRFEGLPSQRGGGRQVFAGAHSCTNARLPIMPDLTGLGSVAGTPMHSVDSVRAVFHHPRGIFQLRIADAP